MMPNGLTYVCTYVHMYRVLRVFWCNSVVYTHMLRSDVIKPYHLFSLGWILLWLHSGWSGFQWRWVRFCLCLVNYSVSFEQCSAIRICTYILCNHHSNLLSVWQVRMCIATYIRMYSNHFILYVFTIIRMYYTYMYCTCACTYVHTLFWSVD